MVTFFRHFEIEKKYCNVVVIARSALISFRIRTYYYNLNLNDNH